jgi:hypothetical protein
VRQSLLGDEIELGADGFVGLEVGRDSLGNQFVDQSIDSTEKLLVDRVALDIKVTKADALALGVADLSVENTKLVKLLGNMSLKENKNTKDKP